MLTADTSIFVVKQSAYGLHKDGFTTADWDLYPIEYEPRLIKKFKIPETDASEVLWCLYYFLAFAEQESAYSPFL